MNYESYSYGLRYFVNDTLHDKFVTNSCNHSGQPRKSSKNVLLYRMQFCGFSNAWHPCIPSHNRHWGSNFRVHRMASNWGLFAYGVAGAFGRQVLQGSDRRWAYYRQVHLSMYKNHQLELSTLVWVTWWCSKNTFALCSCLHLWSFVGIILSYLYDSVSIRTQYFFQLVVTPRWAATLDFVSVTCQRSFRDVLGSSVVTVSI